MPKTRKKTPPAPPKLDLLDDDALCEALVAYARPALMRANANSDTESVEINIKEREHSEWAREAFESGLDDLKEKSLEHSWEYIDQQRDSIVEHELRSELLSRRAPCEILESAAKAREMDSDDLFDELLDTLREKVRDEGLDTVFDLVVSLSGERAVYAELDLNLPASASDTLVLSDASALSALCPDPLDSPLQNDWLALMHHLRLDPAAFMELCARDARALLEQAGPRIAELEADQTRALSQDQPEEAKRLQAEIERAEQAFEDTQGWLDDFGGPWGAQPKDWPQAFQPALARFALTGATLPESGEGAPALMERLRDALLEVEDDRCMIRIGGTIDSEDAERASEARLSGAQERLACGGPGAEVVELRTHEIYLEQEPFRLDASMNFRIAQSDLQWSDDYGEDASVSRPLAREAMQARNLAPGGWDGWMLSPFQCEEDRFAQQLEERVRALSKQSEGAGKETLLAMARAWERYEFKAPESLDEQQKAGFESRAEILRLQASSKLSRQAQSALPSPHAPAALSGLGVSALFDLDFHGCALRPISRALALDLLDTAAAAGGIDAPDRLGRTGLMKALASGDPWLCEQLIARGASPLAQDQWGRDASHYLATTPLPQHGYQSLSKSLEPEADKNEALSALRTMASLIAPAISRAGKDEFGRHCAQIAISANNLYALCEQGAPLPTDAKACAPGSYMERYPRAEELSLCEKATLGFEAPTPAPAAEPSPRRRRL